jgi:hypothetical protein
MKFRLMLLAAIVAALAGVELRANQRPNQSGQKPEQLTVAVQSPLRLTLPTWIEPTPKRFGVFTLLPSERRGEIVHVSMPIGELAMRAAHKIGQTQHRRAEQKARKEVQQAMKDFQASQR